MKSTKKIISLLLAALMLLGSFASFISCDNAGVDNESTRLVLSTSELDGVFNPFYSTSGPDNTIIGMTQIGMLTTDKYGKPAYGEDEACVVLDYEAVTEKDAADNIIYTTYYFVIKNGLKFSDGTPLTMRDVLFNLYEYLDPAYYGSSTIYSTDIVGLKAYRTQLPDDRESEQDGFAASFDVLADIRVGRLVEVLNDVYDDHKTSSGTVESISEAQMLQELEAKMTADYIPFDEAYKTVVEDYKLASKYFKDELQQDYNNSRGTAQDISFTDKSGNKVTLSTDTEAFLYNEGLIKWNEDEYKYEYSFGADSKNWSEEKAIKAIYDSKFPMEVVEVVNKWATASNLRTYFSFLEQQKYFEGITDKITSVSGIKYANFTEAVTVNGKTYDVPTRDANGVVTNNTNEVLSIKINKVDPKAILNFGFTVAPMNYYSSAEEIAKFDYVENFGVKFGNIEFQDSVVKDPAKIGVPVGAGPYKATTSNGDSSKVEKGTFRANNVVYFERNDNFMFDVKIKYINFQVVPTKNMLEALFSGDVHFVEPACKQENIDEIKNNASKGFASNAVMTNGYGYIGINAEKVPSLEVRKAIMSAINTQYAVDYYFGYSHAIHRPMTKASWAYPTEKDEEGQFYKFDSTGETIDKLLKEAGYTKNSKGIYTNTKTGDTCKYTFTIAGDTTDHPAYQSMKIAADILNQHGFDVEVKPDINALKKLNSGDLSVWAAAWGAGVDPDMYQVYHKDSEASSTLNWGYRAILKNAGSKYDRELAIVEELSEIIDKARETLVEEERKEYYADALDMVMELAVELPTYQRSDLFAYNTNIIDETTLTPAKDLTPYNGPMAKLWEVGLNEKAGSASGDTVIIIIVVAAIVVLAGAGVGVFFVMKSKKAKAAEAEKAFMGVTNETEKAPDQEKASEEKAEESPQNEEPKETPKADGEEKD